MTQLRLWTPDDDGDDYPSPEWTLHAYFYRFHKPYVLDDPDQPRARSTHRIYTEALAWWERIVDSPTLGDIDAECAAGQVTAYDRFAVGLDRSTYRRGPRAPDRPLTQWTQHKHRRVVLSMLRRAAVEAGLPALLRSASRWTRQLKASEPLAVPRDHFDAGELRQMAAVARQLRRPRLRPRKSGPPPKPPWSTTAEFHRFLLAGLAGLYYTGERRGDVLAIDGSRGLRREDLVRRRDATFVQAAQQKTRKRRLLIAHPKLLEALDWLPGTGETLLPWPHSESVWRAVWFRWQSLAGIPADRQLPTHALRATHQAHLDQFGLADSVELLRRSANHSSSEITRNHYYDPLNRIIPLLPDLW